VGLAFFIPGYIMISKEKKDTSSGSKIGGIVLMGIGVVFMGGVGLGFLVNGIDDLL
jgi:hypothetical protein